MANPMEDADTFPLEEMPRRKLSFSDSDGLSTSTTAAPERMRAYVRLRPLSGSQPRSAIETTGTECTISIAKASAQGASSLEEHSFTFDGVFGAEATQTAVYEAVMQPQVLALLEGRDTLTFAYGITNAGKTYTVQGQPSPEHRGVLPRAIASIYEAIEVLRAGGSASGVHPLLDAAATYVVRASFLEVYGMEAHDLLAPAEKGLYGGASTASHKLRIKEANGKVSVEGLKEVELPDVEAAMNAVEIGWANRQSASNGINDVSSRSHAVLCVKLLVTPPGLSKPKETRLIVVDLAGAEKQKMTQSSGERLNEANAINKDLMVLGHCLRDLRWNQAHPRGTQRVPPFRNSRITMLFRDFLSGMGQTVVIAALNPRLIDAQSTLETLRFASIAQQIKTRPAPVAVVAAGKASMKKKPRGSDDSQPRLSDFDGRSSDEWAPAYGSNAYALYEQVLALQERLQSLEAERLSDEKRIREEVSAEMRQHMEETEEVMNQRLDEALFSTEEAYHKKLMLVKQSQANNSSAATATAHEDMMQMQRLSQRREAETMSRINSVNAQLDQAKAEVARLTRELSARSGGMQAGAPAAALNEAYAQLAERTLQVREAMDARTLSDASRLEAEVVAEAAKRAAEAAEARATAAESQVSSLKASVEAAAASREELEARCAEEEAKADGLMLRLAAEAEKLSSLRAKLAAAPLAAAPPPVAVVPPPVAVAPPPMVQSSSSSSSSLDDSSEAAEAAAAGVAERILSPKRGLEASINRGADEVDAGEASPAKKLRGKSRGTGRGKLSIAVVSVAAAEPTAAEPAEAEPAEAEVEMTEVEVEMAEEEVVEVAEEEEEEEAPGSLVGVLKPVPKPSKMQALRMRFGGSKADTEASKLPTAAAMALARASSKIKSSSRKASNSGYDFDPLNPLQSARGEFGSMATKLPEPTPVARRTRSSRKP